jgi:hypothetical protein
MTRSHPTGRDRSADGPGAAERHSDHRAGAGRRDGEHERYRAPRPDRATSAVLAVGLVLVLLAVLLLVFGRAPLALVPDDLDRTVRSTGTAQLLVDPGTLTAPATPSAPFSFAATEHIRSYSPGGPVLVAVDSQRDTATQPGNDATLPALSVAAQYALDRHTGQNVPDPSAWTGDPGTTVDRSPAYSPVQLPSPAGKGPYRVWDDEIGAAVPVTADGTTSTIGGVPLHGYVLSVRDAPVSATYAALLPQLGLPTSLPLDRDTPLLPPGLADGLVGLEDRVDAADKFAVRSAVAAMDPVPVDYRLTADVHLLVEPISGAVVGVDRATETLSAVPRLPGAARLNLILHKQPAYRTDAGIAPVADALTAELGRPTATAVMTVTTALQADSARAEAAAAGKRADRITTATRTVPLVLLGAGLVLVLGGVWLLRDGRRRRAGAGRGGAPGTGDR